MFLISFQLILIFELQNRHSQISGKGSIHVAQNLSFKRPLYPNKKYYVRIELIKIIRKKHFGIFKTQIFDYDNKIIVDGTGTALHEEKL